MESVEEIQGPEPKPGRRFSRYEQRYIAPDVSTHKVGDNCVVGLNEEQEGQDLVREEGEGGDRVERSAHRLSHRSEAPGGEPDTPGKLSGAARGDDVRADRLGIVERPVAEL